MTRHERQRITVDLSDGGKKEPKLASDDKYQIEYYMANYEHKKIPSNFDWSLVVNHGKDRGKLATRLARLAGHDSIEKLRPTTRNTIEKAIERANVGQYAYIDWTFDIDWRSGDFGDRGSCYFPTSGNYVQSMLANGVGAVRIYRGPRPSYKGCGRAWMAVDQPNEHIITVYNRYGVGDCITFTKYLAQALKDLGYGNFKIDSTRVTKNGSAHINGDAAVMWNTDLYPDGINHYKNYDGRITIQLTKTKL